MRMIPKSIAFVNVVFTCLVISVWIIEIVQGVSRSTWLPQLFLIIRSFILAIPSIFQLTFSSEKVNKSYLSIVYWFVLILVFIPVFWIGIKRMAEFNFLIGLILILPICTIFYLKKSKHQQLWKNEQFRFNFYAIVAQSSLLFLNVYL